MISKWTELALMHVNWKIFLESFSIIIIFIFPPTWKSLFLLDTESVSLRSQIQFCTGQISYFSCLSHTLPQPRRSPNPRRCMWGVLLPAARCWEQGSGCPPGCAGQLWRQRWLLLAHTDIYWAWAAETITWNETLLLLHSQNKKPFTFEVLGMTYASLHPAAHASCVTASCTGVLLPRRPASPHRLCVPPALLVLWSQGSHSSGTATALLSSLSSPLWAQPGGCSSAFSLDSNHSTFHSSVNPSDS